MDRDEIKKLDREALEDYMALAEYLKYSGYFLAITKKGTPKVYELWIYPTSSRWVIIKAFWKLLKKALTTK